MTWVKATPLYILGQPHSADWVNMDLVERVYVEADKVRERRTMLVFTSGEVKAFAEAPEHFMGGA